MLSGLSAPLLLFAREKEAGIILNRLVCRETTNGGYAEENNENDDGGGGVDENDDDYEEYYDADADRMVVVMLTLMLMRILVTMTMPIMTMVSAFRRASRGWKGRNCLRVCATIRFGRGLA